MEKITAETTVSPSELAAVLQITARHVRRLAEDGIFHKVDGAYNLTESMQAYVRYRADKQKRTATEEEKRLEREILQSEVLLKESMARIATLKAKELTGELHRQEDIEEAMNELVFTMRGAFMAFPGRMAVDIAAANTAEEAAAVIRGETTKLINDLQQYVYDPEFYRRKVLERMAWSENEQDSE